MTKPNTDEAIRDFLSQRRRSDPGTRAGNELKQAMAAAALAAAQPETKGEEVPPPPPPSPTAGQLSTLEEMGGVARIYFPEADDPGKLDAAISGLLAEIGRLRRHNATMVGIVQAQEGLRGELMAYAFPSTIRR